MEVPIDQTHSLVISPKELNDIHSRYKSQVSEWAPEPKDIRYTILTNLQKTYKRIRSGKPFERMSVWVAESVILLHRNGVPVNATILSKAIDYQKKHTAAGSKITEDYKSIQEFLSKSLYVQKTSQLAELVSLHFLEVGYATGETLGQRARLEKCKVALEDSVIDSTADMEFQTLKRTVWGIAVNNAVNDCNVSQTRERLVKRCDNAIRLIDNISQVSETPAESTE